MFVLNQSILDLFSSYLAFFVESKIGIDKILLNIVTIFSIFTTLISKKSHCATFLRLPFKTEINWFFLVKNKTVHGEKYMSFDVGSWKVETFNGFLSTLD